MANIGFKAVAIPPVGTVQGRARKESIYDTEVYPAATAIAATLTLFNNFANFAAAPAGGIPQAKQLGRDTNIQGQQGLPTGMLFYWYGWRNKIRTYNAVLSTLANVGVSEQINRLRELTGVYFKFTAGEYIRTQLDELPSGTGPQFVGTTHASAYVLSLPNGVPDRKNFKDVTIGGKPQDINAGEQFRVINETPYSTGLTPTVDFFDTAMLDGVLVKGIG